MNINYFNGFFLTFVLIVIGVRIYIKRKKGMTFMEIIKEDYIPTTPFQILMVIILFLLVIIISYIILSY
ncbi:hypothetical protein [Natronospora cellulosivora (SeqCode)]